MGTKFKSMSNLWEAKLLMVLIFVVCSLSLSGQYQIIASDSFQDNSKFIDLSKLLIWGTNTIPQTVFQVGNKADKNGLSFKCVFPGDSAKKYGSGYTEPYSLKTCTAIDYKLPVLQRENDSIRIEFDAYWDTLAQIGEGARIVLATLYQYPQNGLQFGKVDSVNLLAPFARPSYNIRILNRAANMAGGITAPGYFFYGGGQSQLGEFEKTSNWWLPGFIAQPGGFSPQTGPSYPVGPTTKVYSLMASSNHWQHFTMKIFPEKIELWLRKSSQNIIENQRIMNTAIPKTSFGLPYTLAQLNEFYSTTITNLPLYYRWAPQIEAVRFYFRCVEKAYLANVQIAYSGNISAKNEIVAGKDISIFPNPSTNGNFQVTEKEFDTFSVMDILGKVLVRRKIENGKIETGINTPGNYLMRLESASTRKFRFERVIIR